MSVFSRGTLFNPYLWGAIEMWRYDAAAKGFENLHLRRGSRHPPLHLAGLGGAALTWTLACSGLPLDQLVFERKGATHYAVDYSRITGKQTWRVADTLQCELRDP